MKRVATKAWGRLKRELKKVETQVAHVGVLKGTKSYRSAQAQTGVSILELAAIHEFGSPRGNVPQRSFIRSTIKSSEFRAEYGKLCKDLAKRFLFDTLYPSSRRILNTLGQFGVSRIKRGITRTKIPPPLSEKTIEKKGSSRPLVDTGRLLNAITWEVKG